MTGDAMDFCADNIDTAVTDPLNELRNDMDNGFARLRKNVEEMDADELRRDISNLMMIGHSQMDIIRCQRHQINDLRDRMYDMDNDVASLKEKLEAAETEIETYKLRNKTLYDTWRECDRELDMRNNGLHASIRIMFAMAAFMLVELLVIACLALA